MNPAQRRLLFLHELDPADVSYHVPMALRIRGNLDVDALERALLTIQERHPILCSRVAHDDGEPALVPACVTSTLARVDLPGVDEAAAFLATWVSEPFDFASGPLSRHVLVRLADDDHIVCVVMHHIAGDGWSVQLLRRELAALYEGTPLPPVPTRQPASRADANSLAYWLSQLADAPVLELPTDRPRGATRAGRGDSIVFSIPAELMGGVDALARADRATPFMVLLAAYQILLARHAGQTDVCVGAPVLGRDDVDAESVIGCFSDTIVLRADIGGARTFRQFLHATRGAVVRAFAEQRIPFEHLVNELSPVRDRSRTPLFQAMFMYLREDADKPRLGDLEVELFDYPFAHARADVTLDIIRGPADTHGVISYDTDLFDRATASRWIRRFLALLADITARPDSAIDDLNMLDIEERQELVSSFNNTAPARQPQLAPAMFAAQVRRAPDAIAVDGLTYREVDIQADLVAALVRGRGELIGVCLRRGPLMVAALIGVWRAGAAYLPLDPDYPPERIGFVVEDSGAAAVLTESAFADRFGERAVLIDSPIAGKRPAGQSNPLTEADAVAAQGLAASGVEPEQPAYVLYTSGSTGRPKGVIVPHRALAAFLDAMEEVLGPQGDRRWLALTSLSFDISGLELFLPLTRGGQVVVVGDDLARDGAALVELIQKSGVTDVQATPSGWRLLLDAGFDNVSISALVGGEALPAQLAARLRRRVGRLVNMYGPTETTIWSSWWEVPPEPHEVLIGRPIAGTRIHLLDDQLRLAPLGVPGEVCIAGEGVALGYLNRLALTADRFLPDPYGAPGARLYRTGDRARRKHDGQLEYLGRGDNQVKVRGHRIELGEIEAVVEALPGVNAAAVIVRGDTLVAYVVGEPGGVLDAARTKLPPYMVPSIVVALDRLPLTPNGKVNRQALADLRVEDSADGGGYVAPRTPAESRVADVFAEVLGVEKVGAADDFFSLGGHSLLAAKVVARLGTLSVRELFDHPSVASLAARLTPGDARPPIERRPAGAARKLTRSQKRLWFLQKLDPSDASYNMFMVVRLRGPLHADALALALDDLAQRHETLRLRYPEVDGEPTIVTQPATIPLERIAVDDEGDAQRLVAARTNAPFDLTARAPVSATLLRFTDDHHILCLVLHHIAGDGWSLNILRDDLAALYAARRTGAKPGLAPLLVQHSDAAFHESEPADDRYWATRLANPTSLELPRDRPRAPAPAHRGGFHGIRISNQTTTMLESLAARRRTTLFTVLLAAYQTLLCHHSGQRDVLVGTTFAGRDRVELEGVVGYFSNTVVLRGDLSGDPSVDELIAQTRDTVLDAMAHEQLPFEQVLADLGLTREGDRTPLFQTMLLLHTQDRTVKELPFADLTLSYADSGYHQAKFDLMVEAWRDDNGLIVVFGFDTDIFDKANIVRLGERFALLCKAFSTNPDSPVFAAPMLTAADEALLARLQQPTPADGDSPPVPELIEAATRSNPDAVAVRCGSESLTYAQLERRVAARASELIDSCVNRVAPVTAERSLDTIVTMLAAWRAGAAYLPLDPSLPPQRRAELLDDAAKPLDTDDAAYVIFTSGSSGRPKGVVVDHRALAARVAWMRAAYELSPADQVVQFASFSFDAHAEEVFPTLAAGATLVLLPDGALSLPEVLTSAAGRDITVLDLPTAYWHQLVEQIDEIPWPSGLRLVIIGGEQAHATAVSRWRDRFGDAVRLVNTYGPTEATIIATATDLGPDDAVDRPPIGAPIGGVRAAVLDDRLRPIPPGAVGELLLGGAGLAHGYLADPELTAQRFIDWQGERWYRTGDLARWRADGKLDFLGRADSQLKVRGFRVEPGEIEAALMGHLGVEQAAVTAHEGTLTAYIVGVAPFDDLRAYLGARLPSYLVPDLWVAMDRLPMTTAGKIDRRALPAPPSDGLAADEPPRTEAERLIARVWQEVLGVNAVGAHDDFFRLGGHSLLAVRVAARLRAITAVDVPIRTIFAHRTVAELASAVEKLLFDELARLSDDDVARLLDAETR